MTYNILDGGVDGERSRLEGIIDVIRDARPDFIAIQESYGFEKNDGALLKKVSGETGLPYYVSSQSESDAGDRHFHITSLSRYPLRDVYSFRDTPLGFAALSVVIDSPLGELSLCNVHFHTHTEEERVRQLREVLEYQSQYVNHIILGDFNALSRADQYGDLSSKEFTHYGMTSFEATDLLGANYIDSAAHFNVRERMTHPTTGVPHIISETPVRIDYIFATKSLSDHFNGAEVIKTPTSDNASDHYPVAITLATAT